MLILQPCYAAKARWSELNIGPFRVDFDSGEAKARQTLANLEQLRWLLGKMLEDKDLAAAWPFRVVLTSNSSGSDGEFSLVHGEYVASARSDAGPSYSSLARIFLDDNTPRLPPQVDRTVPMLFHQIEAKGSKLTWAKPPEHPDFDWARVQLFATKAEYAGRFSVFLDDLRGGSLLTVAEQNAFGKDAKALESEVAAYFKSSGFRAVTTSGRPLDPQRDFGEHSLDPVLAELYLADTELKSDAHGAEAAYKAAGDAGYSALAQEGMAEILVTEGGDPKEYLDAAMAAGSQSAWVYERAAESATGPEAVGLLKNAQRLNPKWWLPSAKLAQLSQEPAEKEAYLLEACQQNPRSTVNWQELAELQSAEGKGAAAQNSWMKAEDAAGSGTERAHVHQLRQALENQRLDAQAAARRKALADEHADEDRLRNDQLARIRAAEKEADTANAQNSDDPSANGAIPWWNAGERPVEAILTRVDCLNPQARLWLKSSTGRKIVLLIADPSKVTLSGTKPELGCGTQPPGRGVSITYRPHADKRFGTSGDVVTIQFK